MHKKLTGDSLMTEDILLDVFLDPLPLARWAYFEKVGSTNDVALEWAQSGTPDASLVLADVQTAGRGREGRRWITTSGAALAMSLVLRPTEAEAACFGRFSALAALGLIVALKRFGLNAKIKWPNDILLKRKKVAGVLVEAVWEGDQPQALVMGLGVNIGPDAVPPRKMLRYPATSVEAVYRHDIERWALLAGTLQGIFDFRQTLTTDAFLTAWHENLAFKGQMVQLRTPDGSMQEGWVVGVLPDGRLHLVMADGVDWRVSAGEIEIAYNKDRKA
jgi:BirA family transcriptional regulator, biotin operon repressor / biotin---[acetyl-CoA-carboxylase] ligase